MRLGTVAMDERTAVVWDPRFEEYDFGPAHPFTQKSRAAAVKLLQTSGFFNVPGHSLVEKVEPAGEADLRRFHTPEYLELLRNAGAGRGRAFLDSGDTPAFPNCLEAAARLVGGTTVCLDALLSGRVVHAFNPGGGLHHAHPGRASGFCVLNDPAVAIARALGGSPAVARLAYVDIDAHHGDGVMYGFYEDGRVLDIDFHQDGRTLFPGTGAATETGRADGAGLKVNLPLPPGAGDEWLLPLVRRVTVPLLRECRPELIVLQHGMDGHRGDPLAQLTYSDAGYVEVERLLHETVHEVCGGRLLLTGGGGYQAGSVAVGLARAARSLAASAPSVPEGLPPAWAAEMAGRFGGPAVSKWIDESSEPASAHPVVPERVERLVALLERNVGRKFPRPS
jgi:acetoin utilization protein AcuC